MTKWFSHCTKLLPLILCRTIIIIPLDVGPIICDDLPNLQNGTILFSSNERGNQSLGVRATYLCVEGFVLNTEEVRTCSMNGVSIVGVWTGLTPQCLRKYKQLTFLQYCMAY